MVFTNKLCTDHNTLWVKHTTQEPFYFKVRQHGQQRLYLQYKICWILYKMVGASLSSQHYLCIQPPLTITTKNPFFYFSQFSSPYSTLNCSQNRPFNAFYATAIFHLPIFAYHHPNNLHQKNFLHQGIRELGTLVRTGTVLISPFLLKVWTVVTGLTIPDSLSFRLRKLVYWR